MLLSVNKCNNCGESHFCDTCKPLLRLRVDGDTSFNQFQLQSVYSNKIANLIDILLHIRKERIPVVKENKSFSNTNGDIYEMLNAHLENANLMVIPEILFVEKFRELIEKKNKTAFVNLFDQIEAHKKKSIIGCENKHFTGLKESMNRKFIIENNKY